MKNKNIKIIILFSLFAFTIIMAFNKNLNEKENKTIVPKPIDIVTKPINLSDEENITIAAVGDILVHSTQLDSQYNKETKSYDFKDNFSYVKPFIEKADLSICNLETTLSSSGPGYSGSPTLNTPDSILDALKYAGFDVIQSSNNHSLDYGANGFLRTRQELDKYGFSVIGTKNNKSDKNYIIKDVKGIKLGITSYTFESGGKGNTKYINSIAVPGSISPLINSFNPNNLNYDFVDMKKTIDNMKKDGADIIIFGLHWGNEYQESPASYQKSLAKKLSDAGVDIILGGHPHVIQPFDVIDSKIADKKTYIIYSLGNFLSNQCYERLQMRNVEDGLIVNFNIKKDNVKNKIFVSSVNFIPTWVYRWPKGVNKFNYRIVPSEDAALGPDSYYITGDYKWRVENSFKNAKNTVEAYSSDISVQNVK